MSIKKTYQQLLTEGHFFENNAAAIREQEMYNCITGNQNLKGTMDTIMKLNAEMDAQKKNRADEILK